MAKFTLVSILATILCLMTLGTEASEMYEIPAVVRMARDSTKTRGSLGARNRITPVNGINLSAVVRQDWEDEADEEVDDAEFYDDESADEDFSDDDGEDDMAGMDDMDDMGEQEEEPMAGKDKDEAAAEPEPVPAPAPKAAVQKLHMEYTTKFPKSCACKLGKGLHNGVCWEFKNAGASTGPCSSRKCKPSYMCVEGTSTGITCMRKLNTETVVSNGDGTCTKKSTSSYGYVPYSGR